MARRDLYVSYHDKKMGKQINGKNDGFVEASWKRSWAPTEATGTLGWPVLGPREGLGRGNPLPGD